MSNIYPADWDIVPFGNFIQSFKNGYGRRPKAVEQGPIVLRLADVAKGCIDFSDVRRVAMSSDEFETFRIAQGDLLFTRVNGSRDYVGKCIRVSENYTDVAFNDHLIRVRVNSAVNAHFIECLFADERTRANLLAFIPIASGAQLTINQTALENIMIPLPPLPEQRAIAAILSTWDEALTLTKRLIDALKRRKAALMQLLLTGEVRFSEFDGAWEEIRLGDFLKLNLRKVAKPNNPYYALSLRNRGQGTLVRFVKDPTSVEMEHLYEVREGDLIVSITFAWEGSIAIACSDADGKLVSHRFPTYVFDKSKVNPDFFKHLMITDDFFFQLGLISPGGAGRNRVLSKKDFVQLTVNVPELAEQMKIGGLLSAYDEYIDGFESYLTQLTTQKRGLMQQLLTGTVRIEVDKEI